MDTRRSTRSLATDLEAIGRFDHDPVRTIKLLFLLAVLQIYLRNPVDGQSARTRTLLSSQLDSSTSYKSREPDFGSDVHPLAVEKSSQLARNIDPSEEREDRDDERAACRLGSTVLV